ncbi:1-acyl-sn-glycerol-3-phosphate acyltransferase [Actinospica robiniae]|uniref:1-acyl-sn-glycerol-3-phosphate acyltransferase n=1 Tax=Actinospica robiniae TaxID=304901 RepID=UPI00040568B0|nr:1-acyl-sn-glycerol-3-phosphate acyltransferase [Actinospica robiniae]
MRLAVRRRPWAEALLAALTRPLLRHLREVQVDDSALRALRELAERDPIVFLPAHRSYLDSLVLARALGKAGFALPWRLAGANLAFWPLGAIGRRSGMIFIRREFGTDPAYHAAVRSCLADLLVRGHSIEWYPEAGRSRTGRLRKLRPGMPRLLVAAYEESGIEDVQVVPVSVVYDSLPDMEAVTAEDAGAIKRPEGLRALIAYLLATRTLGPRRAWMTFGAAVSLREVTRDAAGEWGAARVLTRRVAAGLRDATQVTAESLLALVFSASDGEPIGAADLLMQSGVLVEYARQRRIPLCRRCPIESALDGLVRTRVLTRQADGYRVTPGCERILAYHRNVAEHWFLPRAAAELVADGVITAKRIRTLLAQADGFELRVEAETSALDGGWERQPFLLAPRLLGPILAAYYDVAVSPATRAAPSAELRDAALALLGAEGLLGRGVDAAARDDLIRELACLVLRLRAMAAHDAGQHAGTADVRR